MVTRLARAIMLLAALLLAVCTQPAVSADIEPVSDWFKQRDKNKDGFLTADEVNKPKLFRRADTDGDGRISLDEAAATLAGGAARRQQPTRGGLPSPSQSNVRYGPHERNVFDFWQAQSDKPTPLVVFIHGGGFRTGDKSHLPVESLKTALDAGASVMSINYRLLPTTPLQDILRDCTRAIQYVRTNAAKFNIDPNRIAAFGGSAGAGTSLWLATHDDLSDPKSDDPVLRASSRLSAAACLNGQATYDLIEWQRIVYPFKQEWLRDENELVEFYGFKSKADLDSEAGRKVLADCSMYSLLSKDDPPIWMHCSLPGGEPKDRNHILHHPKHCEVIKKRGDEVGAIVEIVTANDAKGNPAVAAVEFLLKHLGLRR